MVSRYSYNHINSKVDLTTVINPTLDFIAMMNQTPECSANSKKKTFCSADTQYIKRSAVGFIIILIPTFELNVIKELLLVIIAVT